MAAQSPCARGLVAETLSAWRDRALTQADLREIDTHVRTCQHCQRQLTQFDIIGQALQRQHAPDLHDRVWREVQAGMTTRPRGGGGQRGALYGGVGVAMTLLVVMAVVFVVLRANHATQPPLKATATAYPTATAIALSSFVPAAQAWGNFPKQTLALTTTGVTPTDILPDSSGYLGLGGSAATGQTLVKVRVPGGSTQILYTLARSEPRTVLGDGRFVAWVGEIVPGGVGAPPYQSGVGYVDTQTGAVTTLISDQQAIVADQQVYAVDHGYFVWAHLTTPGEDLNLTNMATGNTTRIAAISVDKTIPGQDIGLGAAMNMSFSWPYVFYTNAGQQHLYNITSGKDTSLSQIHQDDYSVNDFALAGTSLFWLHPSFSSVKISQLDVIEHIDQPGASPKNVATFSNTTILADGKYGAPNTLLANSRLVAWNDTSGSYAWDRAQGRLVQIYTPPPTSDKNVISPANVLLHGNEVMYTTGSINYDTKSDTTAFTFFDTSKLP